MCDIRSGGTFSSSPHFGLIYTVVHTCANTSPAPDKKQTLKEFHDSRLPLNFFLPWLQEVSSLCCSKLWSPARQILPWWDSSKRAASSFSLLHHHETCLAGHYHSLYQTWMQCDRLEDQRQAQLDVLHKLPWFLQVIETEVWQIVDGELVKSLIIQICVFLVIY